MKRPNVFWRAWLWLRRNDIASDERRAALEDDVRYWKKSLIETCEYYSTERTKDLARISSLEETNAALRARLESAYAYPKELEHQLSEANEALLSIDETWKARLADRERSMNSQHQRIVQLECLYGDVSAANQDLSQRIHAQARKLERYGKRLQEFYAAKRSTEAALVESLGKCPDDLF